MPFPIKSLWLSRLEPTKSTTPFGGFLPIHSPLASLTYGVDWVITAADTQGNAHSIGHAWLASATPLELGKVLTDAVE